MLDGRRGAMAERLTLAAGGSVVLGDGLKLLLDQAGEILKRWRKKATAVEKPQTRRRSRGGTW
jgi:hypothetical protein